ncbi:MAG: right-handed parallel beta-helix repeat-containing protein [Verrucomicrobiota bacterium]
MNPESMRRSLAIAAATALLLPALPSASRAEPSGGPYGPVMQSYRVPDNAPHVFYVAPGGAAQNAGTNIDEPTTLESAVGQVRTGDAIILRGGEYRTGGLVLNQGITIQPFAGEQPVLKGTRIAKDWQAQQNGLWCCSWPTLFPAKPADWWRRSSEGRKTPVYRFNNDMVFVDGEQLKAVGWEGEIDAHSYYINYDAGQVYIGVDPSKHTVEITAFDGALTRTNGVAHGKRSDGKGYTMRGITFTQYAYRALEVLGKEPEGLADPATFGKDVVGTTLENVAITHCSRVAGYFRGDRLVIRNCLISDTRTEGLFILSSADCLLEKNVFRRNNIDEITGYYPAGVKIFNQCHRATCRDNLVIDQPHSNGIWYDVGNVDGVFVDNWVEGAQDGFFFEISKGAICAGNVFIRCDKGARVLNSCDVKICQNTFVDTVASIERTDRSAVNDHFGWHPSTGPDVDHREGHVFLNNVLAAGEGFHKPLLRFDQSPVLCGKLTRPQVDALDGNFYVRASTNGPLVAWSPIPTNNCQTEFSSPEELHRRIPLFAAHSVQWERPLGAVFQSPQLNHYQLISGLKPVSTMGLPAGVRQVLGFPDATPSLPGAYQPRP